MGNTWQLKLAAEKCTVCRLQNSKCKTCWDPAGPEYKIDSSVLQFTDNIRDLGVTTDHGLKFEKHISAAVHKAHVRAKLILKCFNSRDRSLLMKAFCTYVRPLIEYCTPVWTPHFSYLVDKIEKVQRHFTKQLNGLKNMSYSERLKILGIQSLEHRRLGYDLILVYKILNGLTETSLLNNFKLQQFNKTRGHSCKLAKQHCTHDVYKYFFTNRIVDVWNQLPDIVVCAESLATFKKRLSQFGGATLSKSLKYSV